MSYCAQSDIEQVYGAANVALWADADNDGSAVKKAARIAYAIAVIDAQIDDTLRGGRYALPISPVPTTLTTLAAKLTGAWLYGIRSNEDQNELVAQKKDEAVQLLRRIKAGHLQLDSTLAVNGTNVPTVVKG